VSLAASAARGAAVTLLGQWIRFAIQLAAIVVLARLLTPGDYGIISMVAALAGVATILGDFGLSTASIQARELSQDQRSNVFWLNTALGIILAGVVYVSAPLFSLLFDNDQVADVARLISVTFLLNALGAQFRAESVRMLRFKALAVVDIFAQAAAFGVGVWLALAGAGYWALAWQQVATAAATLVALVVFARWFPGLPNRRGHVRSMVGFGANTVGVQLINYVSSNVDSILLGRFVGAQALGYYDRAYQIFRMPLQQIAAPMTRVALPILSRLHGTDEFERYILRAQIILAYVLGGAFFLAAGVAGPLIEIVLGGAWDPSKVLFRILAIGGAFQAIGYVYYWIFLSTAKTGIQLRFTIISRTLMIALMCGGVVFGAVGVAAAAALGLFLNWLILTLFAVPRVGVSVRPLVAATVRPFTMFSVGVAAMLLVEPALHEMHVVVQLLVLVGIALGVVGLALALVPPIRRDVGLLVNAIGRVRK
jgi:PST family polysaccharide transporter